MRKDGYAAVTSRGVAKKAKLTPQLVHYYFHTMDDLFLALWRRFVKKNLENQARALHAPDPLRALWDFARSAADSSLEAEFFALAHHRKSIRDEIANDGDAFRRVQFDLMLREMPNYGQDEDGWSTEIGVVLLTIIARALVTEQDLGMSAGHCQTFEYVDRWIDRLSRRVEEGRREVKSPSS